MASFPLLRLSALQHTNRRAAGAGRLLPHPLKPTLPPPFHLRPSSKQTPSLICKSSLPPPTPAADRLISAASYFLPFLNGIEFGRFLFAKYPVLAAPFVPLIPLLSLYHSLPYSNFVTFFALYLGIVRNPNLSRYARFNALQALILDVLLVLPVLLQRIVSPGRSGIGLKITAWLHSGIFLFVVACFVYGLVASVLGKTPYLPFVAEAAGHQLD